MHAPSPLPGDGHDAQRRPAGPGARLRVVRAGSALPALLAVEAGAPREHRQAAPGGVARPATHAGSWVVGVSPGEGGEHAGTLGRPPSLNIGQSTEALYTVAPGRTHGGCPPGRTRP